VAVGYLFLIPIIRGISNLDEIHTAECLEQSVAFIGILLFVPIVKPEQSSEIRAIVFSKKFSYTKILILRLIISTIALFILVLGFSGVMLTLDCRFTLWIYVAGTFVSAMALGCCGFLMSSLCNNVISGYFTSFGYFILNLLGTITYKSKLSLFSMSKGIYVTKIWLLAMSLLLIAGVFLYERIRKR
jgi:hypothetical protein